MVWVTWIVEYGDINPWACLWLDESSVDDHMNQWRNGCAALGHACVCHEIFIQGQHFSVLPTLSADGIGALDIFEGSVTNE